MARTTREKYALPDARDRARRERACGKTIHRPIKRNMPRTYRAAAGMLEEYQHALRVAEPLFGRVDASTCSEDELIIH